MGVCGQRHVPAALSPGKRPGTHFIGGWVGPSAGLEGCRKSRPQRDKIPDCPARSQSLYRLSYSSTWESRITYYDCVFFESFLRLIILSSMDCPALPYFPHCLINGTIFEKREEKISEYKTCVLIFSTTFV
jgi:hypothetical protein